MVACSGGADSVALAVAIASATPDLVVAHVVHDMRSLEEALGDRDSVKRLAELIGVPFVDAAIEVKSLKGNSEGHARRLRYAALGELAAIHRCGFVATAHHADDQMESVIMALLRGAGPRGLAGIAPKRKLRPEVELIRPMLGVTRAEARRFCETLGLDWREDATNSDESRLRNVVRARVLPVLEALRPGATIRGARSADLLRQVGAIFKDDVARAFAGASNQAVPETERADRREWDRGALRMLPAAVLIEGLRAAFQEMSGGRGADRLGGRRLDAAARAIGSKSTQPKRFEWPEEFLLDVTAAKVTLRRTRTLPESGVDSGR